MYLSAEQQERSEIKECAENRPAKGRESATGLLRRNGVGKKEKRRKGYQKQTEERCVEGKGKGKGKGGREDGGKRVALYVQQSHLHDYEAGTEPHATKRSTHVPRAVIAIVGT